MAIRDAQNRRPESEHRDGRNQRRLAYRRAPVALYEEHRSPLRKCRIDDRRQHAEHRAVRRCDEVYARPRRVRPARGQQRSRQVTGCRQPGATPDSPQASTPQPSNSRPAAPRTT